MPIHTGKTHFFLIAKCFTNTICTDRQKPTNMQHDIRILYNFPFSVFVFVWWVDFVLVSIVVLGLVLFVWGFHLFVGFLILVHIQCSIYFSSSIFQYIKLWQKIKIKIKMSAVFAARTPLPSFCPPHGSCRQDHLMVSSILPSNALFLHTVLKTYVIQLHEDI